MVSRDLQTAADSLASVTADVDIVSVLTGAAGLGSGLMAAEYAGTQFQNIVSDQSRIAQLTADIGGRGAASAALLALRSVAPGGAFTSIILMMGAFGAASSAVLRVVEEVVGAADDVVGSAPKGNSNSGSGSVTRKSKRRTRSRSSNRSSSSSSRTKKATVKNSAPKGEDEDAPTAASSWL